MNAPVLSEKRNSNVRSKQNNGDIRKLQHELNVIKGSFFELAQKFKRQESNLSLIGENTVLEQTKDEMKYSGDKESLQIIIQRENRYGAAIFCTVGYLLFWAYISFILININYTYNYTQMRLPPSPGPFHSARYNYPWAMSYMLFFNVLNPLLLMEALIGLQYKTRLRIHKVFNALLAIANLIAFFSFLGIWLIYCNNWWSFGSPCDSPLNNCVNFGSSVGQYWSPVTAPGCTPPYSSSQLGRSKYFFLSFLWSLFFFIYCCFGFTVNESLAKLKVIYKEP